MLKRNIKPSSYLVSRFLPLDATLSKRGQNGHRRCLREREGMACPKLLLIAELAKDGNALY